MEKIQQPKKNPTDLFDDVEVVLEDFLDGDLSSLEAFAGAAVTPLLFSLDCLDC
jgi:hypothetical protein